MTGAVTGPAGNEAVDPTEPDVLAERFRLFVATDCNRYTPLYARLGTAIADDSHLLSILGRARRGQKRPTLLLAAIHYLVLASPDHELARFYPSVTGGPVPDGDPTPPLRRFCAEREAELVDLVRTRATQTNEVNRSVALRASLATLLPVERTIAVVEVGASAGLNLGFDRYRVEVGAVAGGPADSPVRLAADPVGPPAPVDRALPPVAWRRGLDRNPVSLADPDAVRWLEACLWPEQTERLTRFRAAVTLMAEDPAVVVPGDMVDDLAAAVADAPAGVPLVVWHSWVLTYLARDRRPAFADAVAALSEHGRDVWWLSAEGPGVVAVLPQPEVPDDAPEEVRYATHLGVQHLRDGSAVEPARVLGRCHPHLRWLEWWA